MEKDEYEGLLRWLLEQASVCIEDAWTHPVTLSFDGLPSWVVVPAEFHDLVRRLDADS